jgi:hypothetical protein
MRDRTEHGQGEADWAAIGAIKRALRIPVVANGNVHCMRDLLECLDVTGADGVMVGTALLTNPAFFKGAEGGESGDKGGGVHVPTHRSQLRFVAEYIALSAVYPGASALVLRSHLLETLLVPMLIGQRAVHVSASTLLPLLDGVNTPLDAAVRLFELATVLDDPIARNIGADSTPPSPLRLHLLLAEAQTRLASFVEHDTDFTLHPGVPGSEPWRQWWEDLPRETIRIFHLLQPQQSLSET